MSILKIKDKYSCVDDESSIKIDTILYEYDFLFTEIILNLLA